LTEEVEGENLQRLSEKPSFPSLFRDWWLEGIPVKNRLPLGPSANDSEVSFKELIDLSKDLGCDFGR